MSTSIDSSTLRDRRALPLFAPPLPRLSPPWNPDAWDEKYEIVIAGAGPAGLFLQLLLARYGLSDASLLCIDAKPAAVKSGQADGLQPRTLEVLKSLGLADEALAEGCQLSGMAFWNPAPAPRYIERTSMVTEVTIPARFPREITIHQGRIERILEDDLRRYSARGVLRSSKLTKVVLDEAGDPEFPVVVEIDGPSGVRNVRTKYLVGADGAHSLVRRSMNLKLEGETSDHVWGVVDFVADSDFPDLRRHCAVHSDQGSVIIIPRERISTGEYLTRLDIQVLEEVKPDDDIAAEVGESKSKAKSRREDVTVESILAQAQRVFKPYKLQLKRPDAIDWWTAYQIGQRVAEAFTKQDSKGVNRIFIVGDACHTHSPKAGQGMNISMMDSYNLSWKLIHSLYGLTPQTTRTDEVLDSYQTERMTIAKQLIAFDRKYSTMFSGKIRPEASEGGGLTHEQVSEAFITNSGFITGCSIEYPESPLVVKDFPQGLIAGTDLLSGIWRPGRRLLNVKAKRHADSCPQDIQDDFPSTGRFRILCLTSDDLLTPSGRSSVALIEISSILTHFPQGVLELVILHPLRSFSFVWTDIPGVVKDLAEMRFYNGTELEDAYGIYGVDLKKGAVAVVRPDGYVGVISQLEDMATVDAYLKTCLREI